MKRRLALLMGALTLATDVSAAGTAAFRPVPGWGSYKFGMSLADVRRIWPDVPWTEESIANCRKQARARYGCDLHLPERTFLYIGRGRLPYTPSMVIVHDRLEEVWLAHQQHGIRAAQCLAIYASFLDGLWHDFGPFETATHPASWLRSDWKLDELRTPRGHRFSWTHATDNADGTTEDARTNRPATIPTNLTDNIDNWGGAHVRMSLVYYQNAPGKASACLMTIAYLTKSASDRLATRS